MASFQVTATAAADVWLDKANPTSTRATALENFIQGPNVAINRTLVSGLVPPKPLGADSIVSIALVLTYARASGAGAQDPINAYAIDRSSPWDNGASWNNYSAGVAWANGGGDAQTFLSTVQGNSGTTRQSTFSWDIGTRTGLSWGDRYSILLRSSREVTSSSSILFLSVDSSTGTSALRPHIVITFVDNPPQGITDLLLRPDISLSEASYTFRQRAVLSWHASDATDFKRYRLRKGVNRSQASDHTHLTFVNSRGSTTYLDPTLYTDGSTIYYSIYPEDRRNGSTSTALGATYCNVSNIVSWTKPDAIIGSVSIGSSASTLQEIEVRVRMS